MPRFIKEKLKVHHYGRYVDDMIFMSPSRKHLETLIPEITRFLSEKLHLSLHPNKIEFRRVSDGIDFIGGYIKPYRTYVRNRTKGNFHTTLEEIMKRCSEVKHPDFEFLNTSRYRINSCLGYMGNFQTFRLRKMMLDRWLSSGMSTFFKPDRLYRKVRIVKSGCSPPTPLVIPTVVEAIAPPCGVRSL